VDLGEVAAIAAVVEPLEVAVAVAEDRF